MSISDLKQSNIEFKQKEEEKDFVNKNESLEIKKPPITMEKLVLHMVTSYTDIMKTVILNHSEDYWFCPDIFFNGAKLNMSPEMFHSFKEDTLKLATICGFGQVYNPSVGFHNVTLWNHDTSDHDRDKNQALQSVQKVYDEIQKQIAKCK